jgi:hypothetical protein
MFIIDILILRENCLIFSLPMLQLIQINPYRIFIFLYTNLKLNIKVIKSICITVSYCLVVLLLIGLAGARGRERCCMLHCLSREYSIKHNCLGTFQNYSLYMLTWSTSNFCLVISHFILSTLTFKIDCSLKHSES